MIVLLYFTRTSPLLLIFTVNEIKSEIIPDGIASVRCDKVLAQLTGLSRNRIKTAFEQNSVKVDDQIVSATTKVSSNQTISFTIPKIEQIDLNKNFTLDILFEDDDIIVVNKPAGIIIHSSPGIKEPTLVDYVLDHCKLSYIGDKSRPGVVHRLDKETSGAIVFAKSNRAFKQLSRAFANHEIEKIYKCIVHGIPKLHTGVIDIPIARNTHDKTKMITCTSGKLAKTTWILNKKFSAHSLLDVKILTGRTHQIRVHLNSIGMPIAGDLVYTHSHLGSKNVQFPRVMLHSYSLSFIHPTLFTQETFIAPLPKDFTDTIEKLS